MNLIKMNSVLKHLNLDHLDLVLLNLRLEKINLPSRRLVGRSVMNVKLLRLRCRAKSKVNKLTTELVPCLLMLSPRR